MKVHDALSSWFTTHNPTFSGEVRWNEPLAKHTYYQIGGNADLIISPRTLGDLLLIRRLLRETSVPFYILGFGSNLLVSDDGFRGVVLRTHRFNLNIEPQDENKLKIGSSVPVSMLLRKAITQGWGGLEFLAGIPGSIGGIITMNAGTHLGETKDALIEVEVFRLLGEENTPKHYSSKELNYSYRTNHYLSPDSFIISGTLKYKTGEPDKIKYLLDHTLDRRKKSQPVDFPSCGSVFKNPLESNLKSWQVIDKLGLRGHQIGQAQFSKMHSNFIINLGGAKAQDVRDLIELAKMRAFNELKIALYEEVKYLGDFSVKCKT